MSETLYQRIGGTAAVDAAVDIFYRKVLADDRISHYFNDLDMRRQAAMQKGFLTFAFGGPHKYSGRNMRRAHARLPGLNDSHFDAVLEHLVAALKELDVPDDIIKEVAAVAEFVRDDVLNR